jgi:hypothetical protein
MGLYMPPDWPQEVATPDTEDWELSAASWLLSLIPEYRQYTLVSQHPVILASIASHVLAGAVGGAREGYRVVRTELGEWASPPVIDAALAAYRAEGFRMAATVRAVSLVEQALRGGTFTRKL